MKIKNIAVILLIAVVLAACGGESAGESGSVKENETVNIKELVQDLSEGKIKDQSATITSEQLIVADSKGKETVYDLPEEDFFVSIAPYINKTHP